MGNETHHVNESADKITLTTKLKRGSGTRDQDTIKVKVKGDNPEETAEKLGDTINSLTNVIEGVREIQPGE